jgi:hypothetical protein
MIAKKKIIINMNTLTYKIHKSEQGSYVFQAIIDGKDTFFDIDVAALDISRSQGGICPILFCNGCGMIGCSGYYAQVEITDSEIIWTYFYNRFYEPEAPEECKTTSALLYSDYKDRSKDFIVNAPLRFNKDEYMALADKLIEELKNFPFEANEYSRSIEGYKSGNRFRG